MPLDQGKNTFGGEIGLAQDCKEVGIPGKHFR